MVRVITEMWLQFIIYLLRKTKKKKCVLTTFKVLAHERNYAAL